jgi:hypothetical protein
MKDLSLLGRDSGFAGCLSFDLAIAAIAVLRTAAHWKKFG